MILINKQPNVILKFCPIDIPTIGCKAGGSTVPGLATKSLPSYLPNICTLTFHHSAGSCFDYIANFSGSLSFFLSSRTFIEPIRITFKRIDSAILKLALSCLKNIVVLNIFAIKRTYKSYFYRYRFWRESHLQSLA